MTTLIQRFLIYIIPLFFLIQANGQITLSPADLPGIGDVQISVKVDSLQSSTLDPGPAGENQFWDYGNLIPCCGIPDSEDTLQWLDSRIADPGNSFPGASLAKKSHCYTYHSHVTHQDITVCHHNFYRKDAEGLTFYGTNYPVNAISQPARLVQPLLAYGESIVTHSKMIFDLNTDSLRILSITDSIFADGWGTLVTPVDTVNALRFRTVELSTDSLFINGSLMSVQVKQGRSWKWHTNGVRFPMLQIGEGILSRYGAGQSSEYSLKSANLLGINDPPADDLEVKVYPNPFSGSVTFRINKVTSNGKLILIISDINGRQVIRLNDIAGPVITIDRGNLTAGIYFYRLLSSSSLRSVGKLIIR